MRCPIVAKEIVVAGSAELAAQLSCRLRKQNQYVPVLEAPRLSRNDWEAEAVRRTNIAARAKAERFFCAGLSADEINSFKDLIPAAKLKELQHRSDLDAILPSPNAQTITWGRKNIGIGLIKALRSNSDIEFSDTGPTDSATPTRSSHLVVCEAGESLSEVIAANYAFSTKSDLAIIPEIDRTFADSVLEKFYALYDKRDYGPSPTDALLELRNIMRDLCPGIFIEAGMSLTVISKLLPLGFAFPEIPSTHLFSYPDLGVSVANGFIFEQKGTRGTNVVTFADPGTQSAKEVEPIANSMARRRAFVRGYSNSGATVRRISDAVELLPYDLFFFATHCGDPSGYRWTYDFVDSEGKERNLVIDIAIGIAETKHADNVELVEFTRFHELDGVDWNDPDKDIKLEVGSAITDFIGRRRSDPELTPTKKEDIDRVRGTSVLKMFDNNYIVMSNSIASNSHPIIFNNACGSWLSLAGRFTYAGARAYIGTLFEISDLEAPEVMDEIFHRQWGKLLPHALWSAQNRVYGASARRPYVMTGVYCTRLRTTPEDCPQYILKQLELGAAASLDRKRRAEQSGNEFLKNRSEQELEFYAAEIGWFARYSDGTIQ